MRWSPTRIRYSPCDPLSFRHPGGRGVWARFLMSLMTRRKVSAGSRFKSFSACGVRRISCIRRVLGEEVLEPPELQGFPPQLLQRLEVFQLLKPLEHLLVLFNIDDHRDGFPVADDQLVGGMGFRGLLHGVSLPEPSREPPFRSPPRSPVSFPLYEPYTRRCDSAPLPSSVSPSRSWGSRCPSTRFTSPPARSRTRRPTS